MPSNVNVSIPAASASRRRTSESCYQSPSPVCTFSVKQTVSQQVSQIVSRNTKRHLIPHLILALETDPEF